MSNLETRVMWSLSSGLFVVVAWRRAGEGWEASIWNATARRLVDPPPMSRGERWELGQVARQAVDLLPAKPESPLASCLVVCDTYHDTAGARNTRRLLLAEAVKAAYAPRPRRGAPAGFQNADL